MLRWFIFCSFFLWNGGMASMGAMDLVKGYREFLLDTFPTGSSIWITADHSTLVLLEDGKPVASILVGQESHFNVASLKAKGVKKLAIQPAPLSQAGWKYSIEKGVELWMSSWSFYPGQKKQTHRSELLVMILGGFLLFGLIRYANPDALNWVLVDFFRSAFKGSSYQSGFSPGLLLLLVLVFSGLTGWLVQRSWPDFSQLTPFGVAPIFFFPAVMVGLLALKSLGYWALSWITKEDEYFSGLRGLNLLGFSTFSIFLFFLLFLLSFYRSGLGGGKILPLIFVIFAALFEVLMIWSWYFRKGKSTGALILFGTFSIEVLPVLLLYQVTA